MAEIATTKQTYRNASYPILGYSVVAAAAGVVLGVTIGDHHAQLWEILLLAVSLAAVSWIVFRVYAHPRVVSDTGGITVINPFHTSFIAWREVRRIGAGMQLVVERRDGANVSAWAVQAAKAARMTGHRSFADDVADDLNRLLVESQGGGWATEAPEYAAAPQDQSLETSGNFVCRLYPVHRLDPHPHLNDPPSGWPSRRRRSVRQA